VRQALAYVQTFSCLGQRGSDRVHQHIAAWTRRLRLALSVLLAARAVLKDVCRVLSRAEREYSF
jgi:hypothetical protein